MGRVQTDPGQCPNFQKQGLAALYVFVRNSGGLSGIGRTSPDEWDTAPHPDTHSYTHTRQLFPFCVSQTSLLWQMLERDALWREDLFGFTVSKFPVRGSPVTLPWARDDRTPWWQKHIQYKATHLMTGR